MVTSIPRVHKSLRLRFKIGASVRQDFWMYSHFLTQYQTIEFQIY